MRELFEEANRRQSAVSSPLHHSVTPPQDMPNQSAERSLKKSPYLSQAIPGQLADPSLKGRGWGNRRKALISEGPLIFLSFSFWHLNQTRLLSGLDKIWSEPRGRPPAENQRRYATSKHMYEHTCKPCKKKKMYILTHKHRLFLRSLTGNHLRLPLTASWSLPLISPTLTHTQTHLYLTISLIVVRHQTEGSWGALEMTSDTPLQRRRLKDALENGGLPKCTFVWTHTGALTPRCYSCVTDTKMMFLTETPDTEASSWTGWMMWWQ